MPAASRARKFPLHVLPVTVHCEVTAIPSPLLAMAVQPRTTQSACATIPLVLELALQSNTWASCPVVIPNPRLPIAEQWSMAASAPVVIPLLPLLEASHFVICTPFPAIIPV